jgi:hypothetical protein
MTYPPLPATIASPKRSASRATRPARATRNGVDTQRSRPSGSNPTICSSANHPFAWYCASDDRKVISMGEKIHRQLQIASVSESRLPISNSNVGFGRIG